MRYSVRVSVVSDNFWTSFRDLHLDGGSQDSGRNGKDAQLHAIVAIMSTGPVGLGDTCVGDECMVNATLVRRLARADGVLLRPDRPMAPMDVMFGSLLQSGVRAMPGLCTVAQEGVTNAAHANCGARLWQTHASVYPEVAATAPELAHAPTRRIVSHGGVDATERRSLPDALVASPAFLLQYLVVSVDQPDTFHIHGSDLYPSLLVAVGGSMTNTAATIQVFWREATDGGRPCIAGSDAIVSGCVQLAGNISAEQPLFDVTTAATHCSQLPYRGGILPAGPNCLHSVGVWQAWAVDASAEFVLLGDLSKYVSLSGYRFRLPGKSNHSGTPGEALVVLGMPAEVVNVTYLRRKNVATAPTRSRLPVNVMQWTVHVQNIVIGATGRSVVELY